MAWLDDMTKGLSSPTGLAVGIGTLILAPVLTPVVARVARPVAKGVLSTGIGLYRKTMEPLSRTMTELVAEARMEMAGQAGGEQRETAAADTTGESDATREAPAKAHRKTARD